MKTLLVLLLIVASSHGIASPAAIDKVPEYSSWHQISTRTDVPVNVLYGIALAESGKYTDSHEFIPWAFAIGVGKDLSVGQTHHESLYPKSLKEAKNVLKSYLDKGYTNLGLGMMQINIKANGYRVEEYDELFDPIFNLEIASQIISQCSKKNTFETMLSCYSHGRYSSTGGTKYAKKVLRYANDFGNDYQEENYFYGELNYEKLVQLYEAKNAQLPNKSTSIQVVD